MLIRRSELRWPGSGQARHDWFSVYKPIPIRCTPGAKSFTLTQTMFGQTMNIRFRGSKKRFLIEITGEILT
jgi:hypothetical protein